MIKVNLGCGTLPLDGWVNLDMVALPGVDVVHDLDVVPWPFKDGEAEEISAEDVFEHVGDPLAFMAECWRVLAPGGHLRLRTSYWKSESAFTDPTHKRFCTELTFDYWCPGEGLHQAYGYQMGSVKGGPRFAYQERMLVGEQQEELRVIMRKLAGDA